MGNWTMKRLRMLRWTEWERLRGTQGRTRGRIKTRRKIETVTMTVIWRRRRRRRKERKTRNPKRIRNPARKKRRRREQRKERERPPKSRRGKPQRRARKERSSPERGGTSRVKAEAHPGSRKREIPMKEKLRIIEWHRNLEKIWCCGDHSGGGSQ